MTEVSYLAVYKEKKAYMALYESYWKGVYSDEKHNEFCLQLINWYDPEISMTFLLSKYEKYGVAIFEEIDILRDALRDGYAAFNTLMEVYL